MAYKILVIDDEEDIVDLVTLVLQTESFDVRGEMNAEHAYDTVKEFRPDAIILDLAMPNVDGWEVFKMIKSDPEFAEVPIAILTAKSQAFDAMVGLHVMKADAYITKPFGKQELIDKINELLRKNAE